MLFKSLIHGMMLKPHKHNVFNQRKQSSFLICKHLELVIIGYYMTKTAKVLSAPAKLSVGVACLSASIAFIQIKILAEIHHFLPWPSSSQIAFSRHTLESFILQSWSELLSFLKKSCNK